MYLLTRKVVHYDSLFSPAAGTETDGQAWAHGRNVMVPTISCADAETGARLKVVQRMHCSMFAPSSFAIRLLRITVAFTAGFTSAAESLAHLENKWRRVIPY